MADTVSDKLAVRAESNGAEVDKSKPATIKQLMERQRTEIARALPKHMDADRLTRIALTVIRTNRGLAQCSAESLLGAVMLSAQLGLEPGPLGHCYFVPFKGQVTFIIGYRGIIDLARRSGNIESLVARTVHEQDQFEYEYGLEDRLVHKPALTARGQAIAYYAVAKYVGGGHTFLVMSREDVDKHRARSASKSSGPWVTDYDAMARKTVIRAMAAFLPLSVEAARGINQDNTVHAGVVSEDDLDNEPAYVEAEVVEDTDEEPVDAEVVES